MELQGSVTVIGLGQGSHEAARCHKQTDKMSFNLKWKSISFLLKEVKLTGSLFVFTTHFKQPFFYDAAWVNIKAATGVCELKTDF